MIDVGQEISAVLRSAKSLICAALIGVAGSGAVLAEEQDTINMHATYLAAPTEWCAADEGVPYVMEIDGPDLIDATGGPYDTVTEHKGTGITYTFPGFHIESFQGPAFSGPPSEIRGRLQATYRVCDTLWRPHRIAGEWKITGPGGEPLDEGTWSKDVDAAPHDSVWGPIFSHSSNLDLTKVSIGGRTFYALGKPERRQTQTFAARTEKE